MRKFFPAFLTLSVLFGFAPGSVQAQSFFTCTRDLYSSVNLRRGPGLNHSIIASIPNGFYVRPLSWVWGADGMRWIRIESNGLVGFARQDYICM